MDLLLQHLSNIGMLEPHRLEDPWVDGMEDKLRALQDKGISERLNQSLLPLETQLEQWILADGYNLLAGVAKKGQNPIHNGLRLN